MNIHPPDAAGSAPHRYAFRIYYEDTDAGGVVYHANYLRYCERARTEALRDAGLPHAEMTSLYGMMFMVRRINLDYLAPAVLDDRLELLTWTQRVGAASVGLRQCVRRPESARDLVRVDIELVCVGLADQRPRRMPPRWRHGLAALAGHESAAKAAC